MSVENFVRDHLELLELERKEELEASKSLLSTSPKSLEEKGVSIRKLSLDNMCAGLFGDTVLEFSLANPNGQFPSNSLSSGDIVGVYNESSGANWNSCLVSGVLLKIGSRDVSIALQQDNAAAADIASVGDLGCGGKFRLVKLASDVTYKRIKYALENLEKNRTGPTGRLIDLLFGEAELAPPALINDVQLFNTRLDPSQQGAVTFCLGQRDLGVVHGPPGTGKTTVVVEVVRQELARGSRLLVCAPSNIAVDNLIERLAGPLPPRLGSTTPGGPLRLVRLGHPARAMSHLQRFTLDAQLAVCDQRSLIQEARSELNALWKGGSKGQRRPRDVLRREATGLRKELRERENRALKEIFQSAQVVFSTLTSIWTKKSVLDAIEFDVVVIDECSQSIEAACWLPIPRGKKVILAGDHKQLPPTVVSKEAAKRGLARSLMERLLDLFPGDAVTRMLTCQYRMHTDIMTWSSTTFYESRLTADESVAGHTLQDLNYCQTDLVEDTEILSPLVFIDTDGCELYELDVEQEMSKGNLGEADLVCSHVTSLLATGLSPGEIGVITPYNLQAELVRLRLTNAQERVRGAGSVEVHSVDGFQGREKEAIVISMVRSNKKGNVGFLSEHRRLNVALTRARRHLCVIGDSHTIGGGGDPVLKALVGYLTSRATLRSAQEYIARDEVGCTPVPQDLLDKTTKSSATSNTNKTKKQQQQKSGGNKKGGKGNGGLGGQTTTGKGGGDTNTDTGRKKTSADLAREEEERAYYRGVLRDFPGEEHHFPETLSARDRAIVHEVAESLGLIHISVGEGKERHLTIRRPVTKTTSTAGPTESSNRSSPPVTKENGTDDDDDNENSCSGDDADENALEINQGADVTAESNQSTVVKAAVAAALARAQGTAPPSTVAASSVPKPRPQLGATSAKPKKPPQLSKKERAKLVEKLPSKVKPNPFEAVPDDDFDALLKAAQSMDGVCNQLDCKTLVRILGEDCRHCRRRFCLSHHQPEVHGCSQAAHIAGRRQVIREGEVRPGSGAVNHLPNPVRRKQLERRLDSKLTKMESQRQGASAGKKKK